MIGLNGTTKSLEIVLGASSVSPLPVATSHRELDTGDATISDDYTNTNGTTAVTIVSAPTGSKRKMIDLVSVYNPNVANAEVTIQVNVASTLYTLVKVILARDERLEYCDGAGWNVYASSGALKSSINQGTNSVGTGWSLAVLAADVVNNNASANTLADVTGLSFAVVAGTRYWFRFNIIYTSAATSTGSRWVISGPSSPTLMAYRADYSLSATSRTVVESTAYDSPASASPSSANAAGNIAIIEGFINPAAGGTVIARFASEIASSAITAKAGSNVEYIVL